MSPIKLLLSVSLIAVSSTISAQSNNSLPETITSFVKALETADENALNALLSDKLSYGHSDGRIESKKELVAHYVSGNYDFVKILITDQSVTELKQTAIVRHNLMAETNDRGKPGRVRLHVLLVWQKENGRWVLIARQATKIP